MPDIIQQFIGTAVGTTVSTSAVQLFAQPDTASDMVKANAVLLANCDDAGGYVYVGRTNAVTATKYSYRLAPGETKLIPWDPGKGIWIIGSAANTDYTAEQVHVGPG